MRLIKPPTHRVDAPIVFVHPADEAWDADKVEKSEEEQGDNCPFAVYSSGQTRFDLSANGVQALLSGSPVEWHLRRLGALELNEINGLMERETVQGFPIARAAYLQAARYGLASVKQDGQDVVELARPGNLSAKDVDALAELTSLGVELLLHVGRAVYLASQPLRDDEKKP